ncbi:CRISPR-associated endonuclease Cas1 [Kamptonema animale CS-326]|jgi:CRISPR-associated protein Cas1|uniref:CRISPR-associated endonuclease Cas1 n=1 Tax=Kamptonema animale TaxID=92934 RepID=UPI00232BC364|nr:CRISPR-associated endonuclease Cas1 [Kamptonema animale]MDB9510549.1 CRISPR-associated endonuclease Cas1 [Kamptonema animale CS-326]
MLTLYVSQPGCYVSLQQEMLLVKKGDTILGEVQLPLLEQILIFGKSQVTTQAIRTCLGRNIPIAYLSRMGYCYGRILPIERGYRQLVRYQQQLSFVERLLVARRIVQAKLKNSRVILQRQQRRQGSEVIAFAIQSMNYLIEKAGDADTIERLMGLEGAGAAQYFSAFEECLSHPDFVFVGRSRRPPGNPVNAMLSFGYQILWNHLLSLIELQGLDPYSACLHQGTERHAALASDLIEEFRAPIIDSLVLWLVNSKVMDVQNDFIYRDSGCFLNDLGRAKFLKFFVQRMEDEIKTDSGGKQPKWDLLSQQIKAFKQFVYHPVEIYQPYQIR